MEELITSMLSVALAWAIIPVIIVFIIVTQNLIFIAINIAKKLTDIVIDKIERFHEKKRPWL